MKKLLISSMKFFCLSSMKFSSLRRDRFTQFLYASSVIVGLEFVSPDFRLTVVEDLLSLSVQIKSLSVLVRCSALDLFRQTGCPDLS